MTTIEEIKQALLQFSPTDLSAFRTWFAKFDADVWDRQFEQDVAEGRFESLANEALQDLHQG
jgi:hypothetical protein